MADPVSPDSHGSPGCKTVSILAFQKEQLHTSSNWGGILTYLNFMASPVFFCVHKIFSPLQFYLFTWRTQYDILGIFIFDRGFLFVTLAVLCFDELSSCFYQALWLYNSNLLHHWKNLITFSQSMLKSPWHVLQLWIALVNDLGFVLVENLLRLFH